ncbi:acyltransferase family protein [Methanosarcina sp. Kolksee]|uniref:acyltransferase family protein n=1 Tax=Methanosarcina sp. Kolksee TaxID=1434099 RepID=UPI003510AC89
MPKVYDFSIYSFFAKIGLSLFIFINGYLIHYNNSKISSIKDVLLFYKKRILRIFPLYWAALAVFTFVFYDYFGILSSQFTMSNASTLFSFHNLLIHLLVSRQFKFGVFYIP